jgi:hypothetical protein
VHPLIRQSCCRAECVFGIAMVTAAGKMSRCGRQASVSKEGRRVKGACANESSLRFVSYARHGQYQFGRVGQIVRRLTSKEARLTTPLTRQVFVKTTW